MAFIRTEEQKIPATRLQYSLSGDGLEGNL